MKINKIQNGFLMNNQEYKIIGKEEIISETQVHVETDKGVILLDTSVIINDNSFIDIIEFYNFLIN